MAENNARKKRKIGSYPFASVVFSLTLAIFIMGLFGLLFLYTGSLTDIIQKNVEVQVYLDKQVTESDIDFLKRTISESDYVREEDGYPQIRFIGRDDAAKMFVEQTGEDFTEFIGDNPLRDAIVIGVASEYQSLDSMEMIKSKVEQSRGVYEVTYVESLVDSINQNLTKIALVLAGFIVVLLLVVVVLINNTIKLAMFSQRFLIRSMQLVGATGSFIRRPFLIRSILYGTIAGLFASAMIYGLMSYGNTQIEQLESLANMEKIYVLFGGLVFLGGLVGYFSTLRAVRKYLNMSLDELY